MLDQAQLANILFIDLETVSEYPSVEELPKRFRHHWLKKCRFLLRLGSGDEPDPEAIAEAYQQRAAIFAEFGKIVCISIGYIHMANRDLRLKSFYGKDERELLKEFVSLITTYYNDPMSHLICGHNIREFDIPYLCRRLVIHDLEIPEIFRISGKKPWEIKHLLDTMNLWKFGDIKSYTSLDLLATVLGIDTPKDDIDGSAVGRVFWEEQDLNRIAVYCEKDVATVAQVFLRMKGLPLIEAEKIISVH